MKKETLPIITEDNEYKYWLKYKESNSNIIREAFIRNYIPLIKHVVRKVYINISKQKQVDYEDLVSYGILGLIDAIEKYNPVREIKFKTYAYIRIKGTILDELRSIDFLPRSIRDDIKKIKHTRDTLETKLSRSVSPDEVASELGITISQYNEIMKKELYSSHLSLDSIINMNNNENESLSLLDSIQGDSRTNPEYLFHEIYIKQNLNNAIKKLSVLEREVIELSYFHNIPNVAISQMLSIHETKIPYIKSKALYKMKRFLRPYKSELLLYKEMPV